MGNKVIMIVIIVLLVILIGLVGFVAFFGMQALQRDPEEDPGYHQTIRPEKTLTQREIDYVTFSESLTSNLKIGPDGQFHAVVLKVSIGVDNTDTGSKEIIELLEEREPVVRDVIGSILRVTTYEEIIELNEFNGIDLLKENILGALRVEFASNLIVSVILDIIYQ